MVDAFFLNTVFLRASGTDNPDALMKMPADGGLRYIWKNFALLELTEAAGNSASVHQKQL